jgi:type IX secretion system PorP/SprF family membrane protein
MRPGRLIFLLVLATTGLFAQQRPVQSLYMFDPLLINPAYAGAQVQLSATAIYRNQWVNLDGAPRTFTATVHSSFLKDARMGLGIIASNDQIGIRHDVGVYGVYSYKIKLSDEASLTFGLQGGFNNLKSDYTKLNIKAATDPNLQGVIGILTPNVGAGIMLKAKTFNVGFSVPQLMESKTFAKEGNLPFGTRQQRYYYLFANYNKSIGKNLKWIPSTLIRFQEQAPLSFDVNSTFVLYNTVGLGVSYRLVEGFVGLFELQLNENFHVGYAYDFTVSDLNQYSNGTHEIMVNYRIKVAKLHHVMPCPTYW